MVGEDGVSACLCLVDVLDSIIRGGCPRGLVRVRTRSVANMGFIGILCCFSGLNTGNRINIMSSMIIVNINVNINIVTIIKLVIDCSSTCRCTC